MKQFLTAIDQIKTLPEEDGHFMYLVIGRNDNHSIRLGDKLEHHCEVVKVEAYGKELPECYPNLTAGITLKCKRPLEFILCEREPYVWT